jgi:hypothetical protein
LGQLRRYDLCESAARRCRIELLELNRCALLGEQIVTYPTAKERLITSAMETRPGLDREKVMQMVEGIFEAEN